MPFYIPYPTDLDSTVAYVSKRDFRNATVWAIDYSGRQLLYPDYIDCRNAVEELRNNNVNIFPDSANIDCWDCLATPNDNIISDNLPPLQSTPLFSRATEMSRNSVPPWLRNVGFSAGVSSLDTGIVFDSEEEDDDNDSDLDDDDEEAADTRPLSEKLDPVPEVIYPPMTQNSIHVRFSSSMRENDRAYELVIPAGVIASYRTLREAYNVLGGHLGYHSHLIPFPAPNSPEHIALKTRDIAIRNNNDIIRYSDVLADDSDTQNIFLIKWEPARYQYAVTIPSSNPMGLRVEYHGELPDAYSKAIEFAKCVQRDYAIVQRVRPLYNSPEYETLKKAKNLPRVDPNPSSIRDKAGIRAALLAIKTSSSTEIVQQHIQQLIKYKVWLGHGPYYTPTNRKIATTEVAKLISVFTKTRYATPWDNMDIIVPVSALKTVYLNTNGDSENNYKEAEVTNRYYTTSTRACGCCAKRFVGDGALKNVIKPNGDEELMCLDCLETRGYYRCNSCSGTYHNEESGCPTYNRMPASTIYNYSQDVRAAIPRMYHTDADIPKNGASLKNATMLRYGVELEVLAKKCDLATCSGKVGPSLTRHAIMKHDSSLRGEGFEIVTAPATLDYHRKHLWNKFFEPETDGRSPASYTQSWDTGCCGIHVHITRAAMDKMQLSKLLVFYHEPENSVFLSKIAGRKIGPDAYYCKTAKKKLRAKIQRAADGGIASARNLTTESCEDHHEAITISRRNGGKTAEVRIFRGNSTRHGIMRCLDFVDATVKWCGANGCSELNYRRFLIWFNQPTVRSQYPDLWKQLIALGYLKTKHVSKHKKTLDLIPAELSVA